MLKHIVKEEMTNVLTESAAALQSGGDRAYDILQKIDRASRAAAKTKPGHYGGKIWSRYIKDMPRYLEQLQHANPELAKKVGDVYHAKLGRKTPAMMGEFMAKVTGEALDTAAAQFHGGKAAAGRQIARGAGSLGAGALAAGTAVLAVDAIDAMGGAEIRKLIAMATGQDPSQIPTPNLKQRLKKLASPVTGLVDLAGMGADQAALALGLRGQTQDEAGEEAWGKKIASEKETEYTAKASGGTNVRAAPHRIGRHRLPVGAKLADVNEHKKNTMRITRSMIKKLVQEEFGFLNTRIMLEHEDTAALAADVVGDDATAGFHHALENIQADVTEILGLLRGGE